MMKNIQCVWWYVRQSLLVQMLRSSISKQKGLFLSHNILMVTYVYLLGHFDTAPWSELFKVYRATINNRIPSIFYSNWLQMGNRRQVFSRLKYFKDCKCYEVLKLASGVLIEFSAKSTIPQAYSSLFIIISTFQTSVVDKNCLA